MDEEMKTKNKANGSETVQKTLVDVQKTLAEAAAGPVETAVSPIRADMEASGPPVKISPADLQVLSMLFKNITNAKFVVCDLAVQVEQAKAKYYQAHQKLNQDGVIYNQKLHEIGTSMGLSKDFQWEVNLEEGQFVPRPMPKNF